MTARSSQTVQARGGADDFSDFLFLQLSAPAILGVRRPQNRLGFAEARLCLRTKKRANRELAFDCAEQSNGTSSRGRGRFCNLSLFAIKRPRDFGGSTPPKSPWLRRSLPLFAYKKAGKPQTEPMKLPRNSPKTQRPGFPHSVIKHKSPRFRGLFNKSELISRA